MRSLRLSLVTVACMATAILPSTVHAQQPIELRVTEEERPVPQMRVVVLVEGESWLVGLTDGEGRIVVPTDLVGLTDGDRVGIYRAGCPNDERVVLVPPGESTERICTLRGPEGAPCGCVAMGAIVWGRSVAIDLMSGIVPPEPAEEPAAGPPPTEPSRDVREEPEAAVGAPPAPRPERARWILAAGGGVSSWPNLDRACEAPLPAPLVSCDVEAERPTFRVAAEYRLRELGLPLAVAAGVGYTPGLEVEHRLQPSPSPRVPDRSVVEVDVVTFEGYGVARHPARTDLDLFLALGYVWAYNRAEATSDFEGLRRTEERDDSGGRLGARAGLDWWREGWGIRLQLGGMAGEGDDVDTSWYGTAMLLIPVNAE